MQCISLIYLQCYSQSHRLLSYRPFSKKLLAGTNPRGRSPLTASRLEQWNDGIVPVKSFNSFSNSDLILIVSPSTSISDPCSVSHWSIYSAIHKATSCLVTGRSQKSCWQEPTPEAVPPLTASRLEQWNDGIVPVKSWNGQEPWGQQLCE